MRQIKIGDRFKLGLRTWVVKFRDAGLFKAVDVGNGARDIWLFDEDADSLEWLDEPKAKIGADGWLSMVPDDFRKAIIKETLELVADAWEVNKNNMQPKIGSKFRLFDEVWEVDEVDKEGWN